MGHEAIHDAGLTVKANAKTAAHPAGAAITPDQKGAAHLLGLSFRRAKRRRYPVPVLRQMLKGHSPARLDARLGLKAALQHRLDLHLRDPHGRFTRHAAVIVLADQASPLRHTGIAEAAQFMPRQGCNPGDIEIVALRHRNCPKLIRQTQAAKQLHAANVGDVHLRMARGGGIALHQHAVDLAASQVARKCHADRTTARDQNRDLLHASQYRPTICPCKLSVDFRPDRRPMWGPPVRI